MKAYRIELLVLDFENYGKEQLEILAMNARGLDPTVISIEGRDIGEWDDDHPLNKTSTAEAEFRRLFAAPSSPVADDRLPPLPKPAGMIEVETSTSWNTFADAYTAAQVRQAQREAYEAGRRKGWFDGAGDAAELMAEAQQPDAHPDPDPIEDLVDTLDLGAQPEQSESAAQKDQP